MSKETAVFYNGNRESNQQAYQTHILHLTERVRNNSAFSSLFHRAHFSNDKYQSKQAGKGQACILQTFIEAICTNIHSNLLKTPIHSRCNVRVMKTRRVFRLESGP